MAYELKAKLREAGGKKLAAFRVKGDIPGVVYGPNVKDNLRLFLNAVSLNKIFEQAGGSAIVSLQIEGEPAVRDVLIKEVSRDPVKGAINHVDFYQFKEGQKLEVDVKVKLSGEAPAVKELQGILVQNIDSITVRCLPKEIISEAAVDISGLKTFEDKIFIKDVKFPASFEVLDNLDEVVVMISAPEEEKKEEAPATAVPTETVEPGKAETAKEAEKKE
jgi:large subunit ribosomal protein L25